MYKKLRTRFAPSPSGFMHLGNARTAIINYLCAKEFGGDFLLRIEDTDLSRTKKEYEDEIYKVLSWLGLKTDEDPINGGKYSPYKQSERINIYKQYLNVLIEKGFAYRCFKTFEELELIKKRQLLQKLPPRYERDKCILSIDDENKFLNENRPSVWRFKIPDGKVEINDKVRGKVVYDLCNFSDIPLTRQDGTFTFLFSNAVDDIEMKINYIIRGEEHISNTAIQASLFEIFSCEKPNYYHMPLLCDLTGKKLSKRDFGFSVKDLYEDFILPEAVVNYLILIGMSLKDEIFSIEEAISKKLFSAMNSSGKICYDSKKLMWINKQWIKRISIDYFKKIIVSSFFNSEKDFSEKLNFVLNNDFLISKIKEECENIKDAKKIILMLTNGSVFELEKIEENLFIKDILNRWLNSKEKTNDCFKKIIDEFLSVNKNYSKGEIFKKIRFFITGSFDGISLGLLINEQTEVLLKEKLRLTA
jgi:nondiscriminating glutamyl-tRNA synthetase